MFWCCQPYAPLLPLQQYAALSLFFSFWLLLCLYCPFFHFERCTRTDSNSVVSTRLATSIATVAAQMYEYSDTENPPNCVGGIREFYLCLLIVSLVLALLLNTSRSYTLLRIICLVSTLPSFYNAVPLSLNFCL
jgi:hypothetical protein